MNDNDIMDSLTDDPNYNGLNQEHSTDQAEDNTLNGIDNFNRDSIEGSKSDSDNTEKIEEQSYNNDFIATRIVDYERKLKEQEDYQKSLSEKVESSFEEGINLRERKLDGAGRLSEMDSVEKRLQQLHDDVKICELYKNNLENQIKNQRKILEEFTSLSNQVNNIKDEIKKLCEERDTISVENSVIKQKNKNLKEISITLQQKIDHVIELSLIKENELNIIEKKIELIKKEGNLLKKDRESLIEENNKLIKIKENHISEINNLKNQKDTLHEEIQKQLDHIRSEIEKKSKNNGINDQITHQNYNLSDSSVSDKSIINTENSDL